MAADDVGQKASQADDWKPNCCVRKNAHQADANRKLKNKKHTTSPKPAAERASAQAFPRAARETIKQNAPQTVVIHQQTPNGKLRDKHAALQ